MPVGNTNYQKSVNHKLGAHSTMAFEFYFYFPREGVFNQFPTNITVNDKVVAVANQCTFNVGLERKEDSFETFRDIILSGDKNKILEFLRTENLIKGEKGFSFNDMLWMLSDKTFFEEVLDIFRNRRIMDIAVWDYSFKHYNIEGIKERLAMYASNFQIAGYFLDSSLLKVDKQTNPEFRHLDYFPIINARAHSVGKNINAGLMNIQFKETYHKFLMAMVEKKEFDVSDWLQLAYYFMLQDRIKEVIQIVIGESNKNFSTGMKITRKINPDDIKEGSALKLQYDYMLAYLDFFTGIDTDFKTARSIAKKYEEYPIISWRILFTEILDQLNEYDGVEEPEYEIDQEDEDKKKQNYKKSKNMEPYLECEVTGKQVKVDYVNIKKVKLKYYVIDLEVLFSRAPFLIQNTEDLANAKPIKVREYELESNLKFTKFDIDPEFHDKNVMIEVQGGSKQQFLTYFSNSMKVHINEDFGELKVVCAKEEEEGKGRDMIPKVYIKVIAQYNDGTTKFFKDGYTDIRGKFEYAQLNSKKLSDITKFAILIMSDNHGALTKEVRPPNIGDTIFKHDKDMGFLKPQQYNRWVARSKKC